MRILTNNDRPNRHNPLSANGLNGAVGMVDSNHTFAQYPNSIAVAMLSNAIEELESTSPASALYLVDRNEAKWISWVQIANAVEQLCGAITRSMQLALVSSAITHSSLRIASVLPNGLAWIAVDLSCQILGNVHVATDIRWPQSMVDQQLSETKCDLVVAPLDDSELDDTTHSISITHLKSGRREVLHLAEHLRPLPADDLQRLQQQALSAASDQPAQILFTSGTTGMPKAVVLSNRNLVSNAFAKLDSAPQTQSDIRLNVLPFCHAYARTCELSTWVLTRSTLAIAGNWKEFLEMAIKIQPTLVNLVPHLVYKLVGEQPTTKSKIQSHLSSGNDNDEAITRSLGGNVRLLQVGGAALSNSVWDRFEKAGLPPLQGYGLTETSPVICSNRAGEQRPGIIGRPVKGVEIKIDEQGQLWAKGDNIMIGYFEDPIATSARVIDGWLATGDLAQVEPDGAIKIIGRADNRIILSTGLKVSPEVVELRLMALPNIQHAFVTGHNQPYLVAIVWLGEFEALGNSKSNDASLSDYASRLTNFLHAQWSDLPAYMRPAKVHVVDHPIESELLNSKGQLIRDRVQDAYRTHIELLEYSTYQP